MVLLINSCSTPHNSGNSASKTVPPNPTSKSAQYPTAGFAEIPLKPSLPPHFTPKHNLSKLAGALFCLFASTKPLNVACIAEVIISGSLKDFCCSKMKSGLLKFGLRSLISFSKSDNCRF